MLIVSDYSSNEARILESTRMSTGWEPEATADRRATSKCPVEGGTPHLPTYSLSQHVSGLF